MNTSDKAIEKKEILPVKSESGFLAIAKQYTSGENGIAVANDYDVNSAVKYLYLQFIELKDKAGRPAKDVVTEASVQKAIRSMVAKGLNPMKKQCYPIIYGTQLQIQESYQGNKRAAYSSNKDIVKGSIRSQVIYVGDNFIDRITPDGRRELVEHTQAPFEKRSAELAGAYAVVTFKGGKTDMDVMSIAEIRSAWAQSKTSLTVHKAFPHEMACKTVESRLAKKLYSSTDEGSQEAKEYFENKESEEDMYEYDIDNPVTNEDNGETQENETIIDAEIISEEPNDDLPDLPSFDEPQNETSSDFNEPQEVTYSEWKNNLKDTGHYKQVGKYNPTTKTIMVQRI